MKTTRARKVAKSRKTEKRGRASNPKFVRKTPSLVGHRPSHPGDGTAGEQGSLIDLLRQAQAAARLSLERALSDLGVTPPQFSVLATLKAHPGLSGSDLARGAMLTPQTVGVIMRNLERFKAIRKTRHPVHGRVLMWTLTRRGETLLGNCRRHVRTLERRLASRLNARTQTAVRRWLAQTAQDLTEE